MRHTLFFSIFLILCGSLNALSPKWIINNNGLEPYKWSFNEDKSLMFLITEDKEMDLRVSVFDAESGKELWFKAMDPEEEDLLIHQANFYGDNLLLLIKDKIELYDGRTGEVSFTHKPMFDDFGDINFNFSYDEETYQNAKQQNLSGLEFGGGIGAVDSLLIYRSDDFITIFAPYYSEIVFEAEIEADDAVLCDFNDYFIFSLSDDNLLILNTKKRLVSTVFDVEKDILPENGHEDFEPSLILAEDGAPVQGNNNEFVVFLEDGHIYHNAQTGKSIGYYVERDEYDNSGTFVFNGDLYFHLSNDDEQVIYKAATNDKVAFFEDDSSVGLIDRIIQSNDKSVNILAFNNDKELFSVINYDIDNQKFLWETPISYYENEFQKSDWLEIPNDIAFSVGFTIGALAGNSAINLGIPTTNNQNRNNSTGKQLAVGLIGSAISGAMEEESASCNREYQKDYMSHIYASDIYYEVIESESSLDLIVYGRAYKDEDLEINGEGRYSIDITTGEIIDYEENTFFSDIDFVNIMNETKFVVKENLTVIGHRERFVQVNENNDIAIMNFDQDEYETIRFVMDTNSTMITLYNSDTEMNETYFMDYQENSDNQLHLVAVHDEDIRLFKDSLRTSTYALHYEDEKVSFIAPKTFDGYSKEKILPVADIKGIEFELDDELNHYYDESKGLKYGYYDNGNYSILVNEESVLVFNKSDLSLSKVEAEHDEETEGIFIREDKLYVFNEELVQIVDFNIPDVENKFEIETGFATLYHGKSKGFLVYDDDKEEYVYFE